jgi:hypothetical protein
MDDVERIEWLSYCVDALPGLELHMLEQQVIIVHRGRRWNPQQGAQLFQIGPELPLTLPAGFHRRQAHRHRSGVGTVFLNLRGTHSDLPNHCIHTASGRKGDESQFPAVVLHDINVLRAPSFQTVDARFLRLQAWRPGLLLLEAGRVKHVGSIPILEVTDYRDALNEGVGIFLRLSYMSSDRQVVRLTVVLTCLSCN